MMRALVLGGTGAIGGAAALRLAQRGWDVEVTGRDASRLPPELTAAGVRFHRVDRGDTEGIGRLADGGPDLLLDVLAYTASDVRSLVPVMRDAGSVVVISSRAVYTDAHGNHVNSDEPPRFAGPIREDHPTVPPATGDVDPFSREGYAPSKAAVERAVLDSGLPVTVIRPSKVHGRWARNPRTRAFVAPMLRREPTLRLADRGMSVDHLTAASNTAALIEVVAGRPGARILNSADPDTPTAADIPTAIALELSWDGELELLEPHVTAGDHPWLTRYPIVLDISAATSLGYQPVGLGVDLLREEVRWLVGGSAADRAQQRGPGSPAQADHPGRLTRPGRPSRAADPPRPTTPGRLTRPGRPSRGGQGGRPRASAPGGPPSRWDRRPAAPAAPPGRCALPTRGQRSAVL
ncbi:reductase [Actinotalea ferrariae CF5-4]|uniref:Reductase n=1 Tax=Actinotalea ferrariae CF5-4 TaxID=948458 RepID=A0A021VRC8_9CELL|nr:reductase [Actinotalea ferrariae CF5-4]